VHRAVGLDVGAGVPYLVTATAPGGISTGFALGLMIRLPPFLAGPTISSAATGGFEGRGIFRVAEGAGFSATSRTVFTFVARSTVMTT